MEVNYTSLLQIEESEPNALVGIKAKQYTRAGWLVWVAHLAWRHTSNGGGAEQ